MAATGWLARSACVRLIGLAGLVAASASAEGQALVVRDGTLGQGALEVGPGTDPLGRPATYLITPGMGEQRGQNLFHSFWSFGIGHGETATFTGPDPPDGPQSVSHVISRVTGGEPSQIDGTLRSTIPGADVWLFNPQGIGFGAGAQIDVPGSFHAGSADSVEFEHGGDPFRAEAAPPSVLATAKPSAFGFLPDGSRAALVVEGRLRVTRGDALLEGGDVTLTGARLEAPGAHLGFDATAKVLLEEFSTVDVGGFTPGSISIRSGKIHVVGGSRVLAENESWVPSANRAEPGPGSIELEATAPVESVLVEDGLLSVSTHGAGNAGTLRVVAPVVTLKKGPGYSDEGIPQELVRGARAGTTAGGRGGTIRIDAGTLTLTDGVGVSAVAVGSQATGDAGNIFIRADAVDISNRSGIAAAGWGSPGKAGTVKIDLGDTGTLKVDAAKLTDKFAYAEILTNGSGTPGTIEILGGSLVEVVNGGRIASPCQGPCASEVGGTVRIGTADRPVDRVELQNGGILWAPAWETTTGNAGTVDVYANTLIVNGTIDTATSGPGRAGSISLNVAEITIGPGGRVTAATRRGTGRGGDILVSAGKVRIAAGGQVDASSVFGGNAGAIRITATESIVLDHPENGAPFSLLGILGYVVSGIPSGDLTGIYSATIGGGLGGSIHLDAPEIAIRGGAFIATSSVGGGAAGDIFLGRELAKRIRLESGGFVDSTSLPLLFGALALPGGAAGSVTLAAGEQIEVTGRRAVTLRGAAFEEWSHVSSATLGSGAPGAVTLDAPRIVVDGGAVATTAVAAANGWEGDAGGDIALVTDELVLRNGGRVDASSFIAGPGGRIDVHAGGSIAVDGEGSGLSSRTGGAGTGGDIALSAPVIRISRGGEVSATSERGLGPVREIFASLDVDRLLAEPAQATGDAGAVSLAASHLVHLDAGHITTSVGASAGGDIAIDPVFVILEPGSSITSEAAELGGQGGRIRITTESFLQFPGSAVSAQGRTPEFSGTVEIKSPDVNLAGTLAELPSSFLDATSLMRERCAARRSGERVGSFAVRGPGGIPAEPDGWLRAPLLPDAGAVLASADPARPLLVASLTGPLVSHDACP